MVVEDCAIVESPAMRIFAAAGAAAMAATAADIFRTTEETFIFDISGWAWRCADVLVAKRMLRTLVRWVQGYLYKKKDLP
jgi:hypothetical protein